MEVLFFAICTHIDGEVAGVPHRVALPAAEKYAVHGPGGAMMRIPNHTAELTVRAADLHEGNLATFAGPDVVPIATGVELRWALCGVRIELGNIDTQPISKESFECLPHLGASGATLDARVAQALDMTNVAAYVDVHQGTMHTARDGCGLEGRHVILTGQSTEPWEIRVVTSGPPRILTMKPDARVTFSNTGAKESPCDEDDYLLHYRLTSLPYVRRDEFRLAPDCAVREDELVRFPTMGRFTAYSTTLSNCSNSNYP